MLTEKEPCSRLNSACLTRTGTLSLGKEKIEKYLKDYLGVTHIIWLKCGIAGDDTDGHVDDLARFVNPTTVVCAYEEGNDENTEALRKNYEILCQSTDQDGKKLKIVKLPMPGNVECNKKRLPASYTNFYIGNKTVLVPTFESENDKDSAIHSAKTVSEKKSCRRRLRRLDMWVWSNPLHLTAATIIHNQMLIIFKKVLKNL